MNHDHHVTDSGWAVFQAGAATLLTLAALAYTLGLLRTRGRSPWPAHRSVSWYLGLACAAAGVLGPVAEAAHTSFSAHMLGHLLLGMAAPLLLVLGAPVTLMLRVLPVPAARRVSWLLRSPWVRLVSDPVVAATLNAGGLWTLCTTELYQAMHASALVHALVLLAGYLFTASLVGVDPDPHRASMALRSVVLVGFIAAHSILAKWLYAHPPARCGPRRRPRGRPADVLRRRRGGRRADRPALLPLVRHDRSARPARCAGRIRA